MGPNFLVVLLSALIPLVIGALWYNKILFGNAWMKASGMTDEKVQSGNMIVIFLLTYIFSVMLAFLLFTMVVHQGAIASLFMGDPDFMAQLTAESGDVYDEYMAMLNRFDGYFRTFKHGAFHGFIAGLFVALPIIGVISLFERKRFKYIAIHTGYWIVTLMLMGGVLCQWG